MKQAILNKAKFVSSIVGIAIGVTMSGCQTTRPPIPQATPIKCNLPVITPLPETKQAQEKGGLEISIIPAVYKAERSDQVFVQHVQASFAEQLLLVGQDTQNKVFIEETIRPRLATLPARLQFAIRINNKLSRVFRGQGSVVQLNVGGKLIPINRNDYAEFLDGIVPPRNETEVKIYGPALSTLSDKGTIGIFLYDVVTATDAAGNTTEKQNYEWYFNYKMETAQEEAGVRINRRPMDVREYQDIKMKEAREAQKQQ